MEAHPLETLEQEVKRLEERVEELTEQNKQKAELREEEAAKKQAHFFLINFFIPFFEGVCEKRNTSLEEGMLNLIQNNETLDKLLTSNKEQAAHLVSLPEFRVVISAMIPLS